MKDTHGIDQAQGLGSIDRGRRRLLAGPGAAVATAGFFGVDPMRETRAGAAESGPLDYRRVIPARGYAFHDHGGTLKPLAFRRRAIGPKDVAIEIHFCGICHTDIHTALGHWGEQRMPQVPGHEMTGVVAAVGDSVTKFRVSDRVGVGVMVDSCGHCEDCRSGFEQYCVVDGGVVFTYGASTSEQRDPGGFTQGGYANRIVVKENFVVKVPDGLAMEAAAPMMCAAVTMYSPLRHWRVGKGSRVGIVGLGGLGHLGVQIARAMGAEVTVFTTSANKVEDARRFGAREAIVNYEPARMAALVRHFDFILATPPYRFEMDPLMATLKRDATLCLVGAGKADEPNQLSPFSTPLGRNSFAGSLIGSTAEAQEVLEFCAKHGIRAEIELIKPAAISAAWPKVIDKSVRYRYVIDMRGFG